MSEPWDFDATLDRAAVQFADHFARADGAGAAVHERAYEYAKAEIAAAVAEHDRQVAERAWDEGHEAGEIDGRWTEITMNPYRKEQ